jgi:molecular chaperone GrpE
MIENEKTPQNAQEQTNEQSHEPNYKELYLRTNADFQNFKRRTEKEKLEWATIMQADIITKILPTIEDLERAIQTAEQKSTESASWIEGFQLILKNLKKTLTDLGVEEILTMGQFNPEFHEALVQIDSPEHASGDIVQVLSKGYTFKGKVIKHARVSVAK